MNVPLPITAATSGNLIYSGVPRKSRRAEGSGIMPDVVNQFFSAGGEAWGIGKALALLGGAGVTGFASAALKTFAKDNTALDLLGLVGIGLSGILLVLGVVEFRNQNSKQKEASENEIKGSAFDIRELDNALPGALRANIGAVINLDADYQSNTRPSGSLVYQGRSVLGLRNAALNLFGAYDQAIGALHRHVMSHVDLFNDFEILNVGYDASRIISSTELKQEFAILIGYIVGASSGVNKTDFITNDLQRYLDNDSVTAEGARCLPGDFSLVYNACRFFEGVRGNNNAIPDLFVNLNDLPAHLNSPIDSVREPAEQRLGAIVDANNYLRSMAGAIKFVLNNSTSQDPVIYRRVALLRSALVTGLRLDETNVLEALRTLHDTTLRERIEQFQTAYNLEANRTLIGQLPYELVPVADNPLSDLLLGTRRKVI